jgi:predicted membrane protein
VSFGSVIIFVPEDWAVQLSVNPVFGSFEDKRYGKVENTHKLLIIKGAIVFGGGELRN